MRIETGSPIDPALFGFAGDLPPVTGISSDSREIRRGDLFIALKGEKTDGAAFVPEAISFGAALVLSHRPYADPRVLAVPDPLTALTRAAAGYAATFPHRTVGITGSYGKTTLRHNLTSTLSPAYHVAYTAGNGNTDLALALTLLSTPPDAGILVAELGMRGRGEISRLSGMIAPDLAVITAIGSSHIGLLGSKEAICDAKCEIADGMKPGGTLFYPANDPLLASRVGKLAVSSASVSLDPAIPSSYALRTDSVADGKATVSLSGPEGELSGVVLPGCDPPILFSAAFCFAVCEKLGVDRAITRDGLTRLSTPPLRRQIEEIRGVTVVLDCYNASPEPTVEALAFLKRIRGEKKRIFLVLGDMRELGENAVKLHREVGRRAAELSPALLVCVGDLAREYGIGATEAGMSRGKVAFFSPDDLCALAAILRTATSPGDLLFVKGSRALALERFLPYFNHAEN